MKPSLFIACMCVALVSAATAVAYEQAKPHKTIMKNTEYSGKPGKLEKQCQQKKEAPQQEEAQPRREPSLQRTYYR